MTPSLDSNAYLDLLKDVLTAAIYEESSWSSTALARSGPRLWLHKCLSHWSLLLVRRRSYDPQARSEGRDWPMFGYTMAGQKRLDNVQRCVETVLQDGIAGDFIETGAWRGGMTIFMRALLRAYGVRDRCVWVADSFEGLPAPIDKADGWNYSDVDYLKVSLAQVQNNFKRFGLLDEQVRFLPGWFCDTLPTAPIQKLALLRLDGDMYSSTRDALVNLYHRVSPGGFVIVDDYFSWPACQRAVDEFRAEHGLIEPMQTIDWTGAFWRVSDAATVGAKLKP
jgi:Macrocin-O-methyltransferase (TylF)